MMFRAVFWVVLPTIILHGSTTQKTALNITITIVGQPNCTGEVYGVGECLTLLPESMLARKSECRMRIGDRTK
jgi:hypothetical protein